MNVFVTGGGGFLGKAIVRRLIARGDSVTSFSRGHYPELAALGARCVAGDIANPQAVSQAAAGADAIIHTAAKAGVWGPYSEYHAANITGTANVVRAAQEHHIAKIVYTSSPSAVFAGKDQSGIDESVPFPAKHLSHYGTTKAEAERIMVAANGPDLGTVSLRPHLIWGPGDPHIMPRFVERARQGRLFMIGSRINLVDAVFVENAADAHILALDRVAPGSSVAGRAFFITNHEPWPIERLVNGFLNAAGLAPVTKHVPEPVVFALALACEAAWTVLGRVDDPPMTRFLFRNLTTSHWYKNDLSTNLLGYLPKVTMAEGMQLLKAH